MRLSGVKCCERCYRAVSRACGEVGWPGLLLNEGKTVSERGVSGSPRDCQDEVEVGLERSEGGRSISADRYVLGGAYLLLLSWELRLGYMCQREGARQCLVYTVSEDLANMSCNNHARLEALPCAKMRHYPPFDRCLQLSKAAILSLLATLASTQRTSRAPRRHGARLSVYLMLQHMRYWSRSQ